MKNNFTLLIAAFLAIISTTTSAQVVTSGADDGSNGTLRQEIADTPAGGEITFAVGIGTVTLNSEITINKEITISGGLIGIGTTTIDGDNNSRIFNITDGPVILNNLVITNGVEENGGGIYVTNATLEINDSAITNNIANGTSGSGGGIFVDAGGSLTVNDSSITGNRANRAGGGIEDNSNNGLNIVLNNVNLDENNAGVSPATGAPGNGGGLHITGAGNAEINGGTVNNNVAELEGGGLWNGTGSMMVDGTTIDGNSATGDAADDGGGGIFNNGGTLNVQDATVSNNVADGTSGSGGGILNVGGIVLVQSSTISGNTSNRAGGGIEHNSATGGDLTLNDVALNNNSTEGNPGNGGGLHITGPGDSLITNGTVNGNTASLEGGGLWNGSGTMTIEGTVIDGNTANGDMADEGGGGVFNEQGTINISGATISNNVADGTSGSGGGILNNLGVLTVQSSDISGNTAVRAGGGIEDNSVAGNKLILNNVNLDGNSADGNPGNGGGLHITGEGDVDIIDSNVTDNSASREGGGLWNSLGIMYLEGTSVTGNFAEGDAADDGGAGIFNNGGTLTIHSDSEINNNIANGASSSGGGILSVNGNVSIADSNVNGNAANRAGGAIEIIDGNLTVFETVMDGNDVNGTAGTANPGNGGAVHITGMGGTIIISRSDITNNSAANEGGGLWNQSGTTFNVDKTTVDGNIAEGDGGGGLYNNGGTYNVVTSTISNNTATTQGGGIFNDIGTFNLMSSTVSGNDAAEGAGVYNSATMELNAVTISLNTASTEGGGINSEATTSLKNTIVAGNSSPNGQDLGGTGNFASNNYNLIGNDDENIFPAQANDQEGILPQLGPLQDNGGFTFTHELLEGSEGINDGNPSDLFTDQRNFSLVGTRDVGAYERDGVLGIDDNQQITSSVVYPNPTRGEFNIDVANTVTGQVSVEIISISGKLVQTKVLNTGVNQLNINGLSPGMYIVKVYTPKNATTHKLILQ